MDDAASTKCDISESRTEQISDPKDDITNSESIGTPVSVITTGGPEMSKQSTTTSKPPLAFCSFIVKRPKLSLGLTMGCHMLLLLVTISLILGGYDILPVNFQDVPLDLTDHVTYIRAEGWRYKDTHPAILQSVQNDTLLKERSETLGSLVLFFEGKNVFSKESLKSIKTLEEEFTAIQGYQDYCQLIVDGGCRPPQSVIRFFDGTVPGPLFNDPDFNNIYAILEAVQSNPELSVLLDFFLGQDFLMNNSTKTAYSSITRCVIFFGSPLNGTSDTEELKTFLLENYKDRLNDLVGNGYGGMDFTFFSSELYWSDVGSQVVTDLLLAAGSFTFIFVFVLSQTQSLFVSSLALLSILTSFTGANLIYRIVFDFKYFGIFHILSVFIILGIGADDIFVFYDTWRATSHEGHPSLEHRLSECYRRAVFAMFITSLTTMIAFVVNAFSPLLAISSFGLFSGILILVNYLSVITFFPCVVVVYHLYWEQWTWPFFKSCKKSTSSVSNSKKAPPLASTPSKKGPVVRFCAGPYFRFITHKVARWIILAGFVAFLATFVYFATTLKPDEESVRIFKQDHNYQKAKRYSSSAFKPNQEDKRIKVYIIWGIGSQDRSMCHKTDFGDCTGETIWDESFDLNPKPAQMALQAFCQRIERLTDEENTHLHIGRNPKTGLLEVNCFMQNLGLFFANKSEELSMANLGLPITETNMVPLMVDRTDVYNISALSQYFYRYFEVGMAYWLSNGYSEITSSDEADFEELLGESKDVFDTVSVTLNDTEYHYGTRLRYAAIVINTTLQNGNVGFDSGIPIVKAWEDFTNKQMKDMPPSVSGGFQCTPEGGNMWHWLHVQETLATNAVNGVITGIALAFPILVIATQNIVIGFLATMTIGCITLTVVGLIPIAGWKLGVLESLNLSLVVGLSVDYVVHLAEAYHSSTCKDRRGRVRDMLEHVGVSVISGACTTVGASFFMLFAQILFFMQFGIFMFCTIGFSLLYSLGAFSTLLGLIGPEGDFGSIKPVFYWLRNKMIGRKCNAIDCKTCAGKGFVDQSEDNSSASGSTIGLVK